MKYKRGREGLMEALGMWARAYRVPCRSALNCLLANSEDRVRWQRRGVLSLLGSSSKDSLEFLATRWRRLEVAWNCESTLTTKRAWWGNRRDDLD